MAAFVLAHLSDPHLPPLPRPRLRELAGKRALGYLNWTRNRHKYHRREVLDALVAGHAGAVSRTTSRSPATWSISRWRRNSRRHAPGWKASARPTVTAVPGNHDAYVRATRLRFAEFWRDICAATSAPMAGSYFPFAAPARPAGADQPVLRGADAALHGDGNAGRRAARGAGSPAGGLDGRTDVSRAADASSAAIEVAFQAADRFGDAVALAQAPRRRADAARP